MNRVKERSMTPEALRFRHASSRLFNYAKFIKLFTYFLAIGSVVLSVLPSIKENVINLGGKEVPVSFFATIISFTITIVSDLISQFITNVKEHAILERQLYQCEITGSAFSKIEYDRELTNELNELAIRRGHPSKKNNIKPFMDVPQDISDDYSYLYLTRLEAAKTNFLLSRMYIIYIFILALIIIAIVSLAVIENETIIYLQLIIGFYPLLSPIIKNLSACKKASSNCVKICADIDNFFADGDDSLERLARFHYYVQNIEFEMMLNRPTLYKFVTFIFSHGVRILDEGVTSRFKNSIIELKKRSLMLSSGIAIPRAQELITRRDYSLEELEKKSLRKQLYYYQKGVKEASSEIKNVDSLTVETPKKPTTKKAKETTTRPKAKTSTSSKTKSSSAKTLTKAKTEAKKTVSRTKTETPKDNKKVAKITTKKTTSTKKK